MYYHNMQDKDNDCGFAVSQTILQQLGLKKVSLNMIWNCIANEISQGLSLQDLMDILQTFSVNSSAYEVNDFEEILKCKTPFIATISNNGLPHYIVVHKITKEKVVISNPMKSQIEEEETKNFSYVFSGYIILIENNEKPKIPKNLVNSSFISKFYKESLSMIPFHIKVKMFFYSIIKLIAPLLIILGFQYIMIFKIENINILDLTLTIIISFILLIFYFYINMKNLGIRNNIERKMQEVLITQYYKGILELKEEKYVQNNSELLGSFWNILLSVPGIIQKFYFKINFTILIFFMLCLAAINVYLAIGSIIIFTLFSLLLSVVYKKVYNHQKNLVMEINKFGGTVTQLISSILDIKIFNKQKDSISYLENSINEYSNSKNNLKTGETKVTLLLDIFVYFIIIFGFVLYILSFIYNLNVSAPILLLSLFILFILATESKGIFNMLFEYQKSKVAIEYLQQEVNLFSPVTLKEIEYHEQAITSLRVQNLVMSYGEKEVLNNFNININAGEIIGIRGNNGSGKTTLLKVLSGLITPKSGNIIINNTDTFQTLEGTSIIKQIMLYTPEYYIYNNTVKNNYHYNIFNGDSNKEQELINNIIFPLDTPDNFVVGLSGENISLGQKNKILLLRSLIAEKDIYLLDEPSTSLDYKSTIALINVLQTLTEKNKIVLIVSHDKNLLDICDRIIDLESLITARI